MTSRYGIHERGTSNRASGYWSRRFHWDKSIPSPQEVLQKTNVQAQKELADLKPGDIVTYFRPPEFAGDVIYSVVAVSRRYIEVNAGAKGRLRFMGTETPSPGRLETDDYRSLDRLKKVTDLPGQTGKVIP